MSERVEKYDPFNRRIGFAPKVINYTVDSPDDAFRYVVIGKAMIGNRFSIKKLSQQIEYIKKNDLKVFVNGNIFDKLSYEEEMKDQYVKGRKVTKNLYKTYLKNVSNIDVESIDEEIEAINEKIGELITKRDDIRYGRTGKKEVKATQVQDEETVEDLFATVESYRRKGELDAERESAQKQIQALRIKRAKLLTVVSQAEALEKINKLAFSDAEKVAAALLYSIKDQIVFVTRGNEDQRIKDNLSFDEHDPVERLCEILEIPEKYAGDSCYLKVQFKDPKDKLTIFATEGGSQLVGKVNTKERTGNSNLSNVMNNLKNHFPLADIVITNFNRISGDFPERMSIKDPETNKATFKNVRYIVIPGYNDIEGRANVQGLETAELNNFKEYEIRFDNNRMQLITKDSFFDDEKKYVPTDYSKAIEKFENELYNKRVKDIVTRVK